MSLAKAPQRFFYWLLGVDKIEQKVENIKHDREEIRGDLRQTQQKMDSLYRLVQQMRKREDWFNE